MTLCRPARRLRPSSLVALGTVLLLLGAVLAAPLLTPHDPSTQHLQHPFAPPGGAHLLGTDHLGRDLLSRLLHGGRPTLSTALVVLVLALLAGGTVGLLAGYCGGRTDALLMRLADAALAFPPLLLAVAVAGTLGQSLVAVVVALLAVTWAGFARVARSLVLLSREQQYVLAAVALGSSRRRVLTKDVLPNIVGPICVVAALELGNLVLSIAGLSFLGVSVQPPAPEWGAMLRTGQAHLQTHPQLVAYPGALLVLVVVSINVLADALRDAQDPTPRA